MSLNKKERLTELDGLRGIAIAMVLVFHYESFPPVIAGNRVQQLYLFIARHLWAGVDLFFVLSGFLITGILLRTRGNSNYFTSFYGKRILRILPVAVIAIGGWFWIGAPLLRTLHTTHSSGGAAIAGGDLPSSTQIWYFLFLQNWLTSVPPVLGHLWSLAIEEQFYLLWPFIIVAFPRRPGIISVGIVFASLATRAGLIIAGLPLALIHRITFSRIDQLAIGALLAISIYQNKSLRIYRWMMIPSILGLGIIIYLDAVSQELGQRMTVLLSPPLLAMTFAGIISMVLTNDSSGLAKFLRLPVLRSLGKYSYAIYVFHYPVFLALYEASRSRFRSFWAYESLVLVAGATISWMIAWISWQLIEKRMFALKERLWPPSASPASGVSRASSLLKAVAG